MQPQNEDQVRSMRELLQTRKDVSAKLGRFFSVLAQTVWGVNSSFSEKSAERPA